MNIKGIGMPYIILDKKSLDTIMKGGITFVQCINEDDSRVRVAMTLDPKVVIAIEAYKAQIEKSMETNDEDASDETEQMG